MMNVLIYDGVDFSRNDWFAEFHLETLTESCAKSWLECYGKPEDYMNPLEDDANSVKAALDEYWARCGFFVIGWRSGRLTLQEELSHHD